MDVGPEIRNHGQTSSPGKASASGYAPGYKVDQLQAEAAIPVDAFRLRRRWRAAVARATASEFSLYHGSGRCIASAGVDAVQNQTFDDMDWY